MTTRYDTLFRIAHEIRPKKIMEIGVRDGKTAEKLIKIAKRYHDPSEIEYHGFDLFENPPPEEFDYSFPKTKATVYKCLAPLGVLVLLYEGNTHDTLPRALPALPGMDLIFIDGGHSLMTIYSDFHLASLCLSHLGGVIVLDDYWDRVDAGCRYLVENCLSRKCWDTKLSPEKDVYESHPLFGRLEVQMAVVRWR